MALELEQKTVESHPTEDALPNGVYFLPKFPVERLHEVLVEAPINPGRLYIELSTMAGDSGVLRLRIQADGHSALSTGKNEEEDEEQYISRVAPGRIEIRSRSESGIARFRESSQVSMLMQLGYGVNQIFLNEERSKRMGNYPGTPPRSFFEIRYDRKNTLDRDHADDLKLDVKGVHSQKRRKELVGWMRGLGYETSMPTKPELES
jgi:hypothetical protein